MLKGKIKLNSHKQSFSSRQSDCLQDQTSHFQQMRSAMSNDSFSRDFLWLYVGVPFSVLKSVWRSSFSRDGLSSKIRLWSTQFLFEIYDHMSKSDFGPLLNDSNFRFWSVFEVKRIEVRNWVRQNRVFVHHVRKNSFKYFCGPKSRTLRT